MLTGKTEMFTALHKQVVVDMSYVFEDATEVKKEADENGEESKTPENPQEFWSNLSSKLEYLKTERGRMQFYRESFLDLVRTAIEQLATKRWAKSSVSAFVKEVFYNKQGFFNKEQTDTIDELMAALNNDSVLMSSSLLLPRNRPEARTAGPADHADTAQQLQRGQGQPRLDARRQRTGQVVGPAIHPLIGFLPKI